MNYIDIVILLFLLYGAFRGFSKGLIIEVATLAGLISGAFIAIRYSPFTEGILKDFLNITSRYLSYIALAVTFLLVVIAVYLLGKMLTRLVDIISLGLVNKLLGTLLGIAKYFIMVCVLLMIVDALNDEFRCIGERSQGEQFVIRSFFLTLHNRCTTPDPPLKRYKIEYDEFC